MVTRSTKFNAHRRRAAFTLMEALLALAISGVVLAAIGGVFFAAIKLRDRTFASLNDGSALQPVLTILKRDLRGALPPQGIMVLRFRCGLLGGEFGEGYGLQFTTTTGSTRAELPGGDLQEITYMLRDSSNRARGNGMDLVRLVNRNLLAIVPELPPEELLAESVQEFQVQCYDGYEWKDSWDTTLTDTNLPLAVRIQLLVTPQENRIQGSAVPAAFKPTEVIVPLLAQARTSPTNTLEEGVEQ